MKVHTRRKGGGWGMELQYITKEREKSGEGEEGGKGRIELHYKGSGEKWKCTL